MKHNLIPLFIALAMIGTADLFSQDQAPYKGSLGIGMAFRDFTGLPRQNADSIVFHPALRIQAAKYLGPSFDAVFEGAIPLGNFSQPEDPEDLTALDLNLRYKFNNGYILKETSLFAPFIYTGVSTNVVDWSNPQANVGVPFGLGFRIQTNSIIALDFHGNYQLSVTDYIDYVTLSAGLTFLLGRPKKDIPPPPEPDKDGDGIADVYDECPTAFGLAAYNGCPDRDGDGVIDQADNCPDTPGSLAMLGCPEEDADLDGVPDDQDECPNAAGLASLNGCPDRDNDNVPDHLDNCPNLPGNSSAAGCPDSDGDGVADDEDTCPDQFGIPALAGCPEIEEEVAEQLEFAAQRIQFRSNSSELLETSFPILDTVANILIAHPAYHLRASGHTDSRGDDDLNLNLSERRAQACIEYLNSVGIDLNRLVYIGYGENQPIADNFNEEGRQKNRRVVFEMFIP
ncbi:MAG: OmpA family protein [Bacteroidota bacterium]